MNKFNFNKRKAIQVALSTLAIERLKKIQEYTNKQIETSEDCNEPTTTQSLRKDTFHTIPTVIVYVEFSAGTQSNIQLYNIFIGGFYKYIKVRTRKDKEPLQRAA